MCAPPTHLTLVSLYSLYYFISLKKQITFSMLYRVNPGGMSLLILLSFLWHILILFRREISQVCELLASNSFIKLNTTLHFGVKYVYRKCLNKITEEYNSASVSNLKLRFLKDCLSQIWIISVPNTGFRNRSLVLVWIARFLRAKERKCYSL